MPYTKEHRAQVRDRIVESARRLFNRSGFEAVSIASIMEEAGLTHGGFYAYFKVRFTIEHAIALLNGGLTDGLSQMTLARATRPEELAGPRSA